MMDMTSKKPIRLAVLASGGGRTLQNFIDRIADGRLRAEIAHVFVSKRNALAAERAKNAGIATTVVSPKPPEQASAQVFGLFRTENVDLVLMAGWLNLLPIPDDFMG